MQRYNWSLMSPFQIGRYGEYSAKIEFTRLGCDVNTAEVDDRGIDFVIRTEDRRYFDIQVKTVHKAGVIFFSKDKFPLRSKLLAAIAILDEGKLAAHYLIEALAWEKPDALLTSHDRKAKGLKGNNKCGLSSSERNMHLLEKFAFHETVARLQPSKDFGQISATESL